MQQHLPVGGLGPDAEDVAAMRAANWTPSVRYWRQKHDEARAEIARLQSRLQAMTENAERLALGLEEAQYDNVDWRRALDDISAHRKLMEGK